MECIFCSKHRHVSARRSASTCLLHCRPSATAKGEIEHIVSIYIVPRKKKSSNASKAGEKTRIPLRWNFPPKTSTFLLLPCLLGDRRSKNQETREPNDQ
eukprot:scaffold4867_cov136-Skeletonema_dohrnii-CCMP3373.AAC.7